MSAPDRTPPTGTAPHGTIEGVARTHRAVHPSEVSDRLRRWRSAPDGLLARPAVGYAGRRKGQDVDHRFRLRVPRRRRDAAAVGLIVLASVAALLPGMAVGARQDPPPRMGEFLWAMAGQESGWNYTARNSWSGAYGKYQIMPANWPSWSRQYLGGGWADQTPRNQELVVRGKIADLHRWLGTWRRVAYWWLTGGTERDESKWSSVARGYVNNIMQLRKRAPKGGDPIPPSLADTAPPARRGQWRIVVGDESALTTRISGPRRRRVTGLRDGQVVFVQGSRWNAQDVLWMRVSTASGHVGWLSIRRTVPGRKPAAAGDYPRGQGVTDPDRDDRRRDRARPRPR